MKSKKKKALALIAKLKKLFPDTRMILNYGNNWELLVAVILSAQCTDKKVNEVTTKLFKKYKTLDDYAGASASRRTISKFEQDIKPTGFYRAKTKNILAAAGIIKNKFCGQVPKTMSEILTIPGVGRKTANVVLGNAYRVIEGIAVDTHVRRLSKLYGLTTHDDPIRIEKDLMAVIPKKDWFRFTYLMIDYGRKYCPARKHDHKNCPL